MSSLGSAPAISVFFAGAAVMVFGILVRLDGRR